jgi:hypothetical protein
MCASYALHSFRCSSHGYYGREQMVPPVSQLLFSASTDIGSPIERHQLFKEPGVFISSLIPQTVAPSFHHRPKTKSGQCALCTGAHSWRTRMLLEHKSRSRKGQASSSALLLSLRAGCQCHCPPYLRYLRAHARTYDHAPFSRRAAQL